MRTREFPELCGERRCVETTITVLQRAVGGERRTSLEERRSRAWRLLRMRMPGARSWGVVEVGRLSLLFALPDWPFFGTHALSELPFSPRTCSIRIRVMLNCCLLTVIRHPFHFSKLRVSQGQVREAGYV